MLHSWNRTGDWLSEVSYTDNMIIAKFKYAFFFKEFVVDYYIVTFRDLMLFASKASLCLAMELETNTNLISFIPSCIHFFLLVTIIIYSIFFYNIKRQKEYFFRPYFRIPKCKHLIEKISSQKRQILQFKILTSKFSNSYETLLTRRVVLNAVTVFRFDGN